MKHLIDEVRVTMDGGQIREIEFPKNTYFTLCKDNTNLSNMMVEGHIARAAYYPTFSLSEVPSIRVGARFYCSHIAMQSFCDTNYITTEVTEISFNPKAQEVTFHTQSGSKYILCFR